MHYRMLGKTGLKISEMGHGCWGIGGGVPNEMWKSNDVESRAALRTSVENGVNFFDTAFVYGDGHSERLVGKLAREHPDIIITTKIPPKNRLWPTPLNGKINDVFPKDYILEYAKKSYQNIGRSIDLLLLHVWTDAWIDERAWEEAFEQIKEENLATHFGVSVNDHAPQTVLKLVASGKIEALEVIYNIFDQSPADALFPLAQEHNIGIIARVPFDEGSLTGTFTYDTRFDDWRSFYFREDRLKETVDRVEKLRFLETNKRTLPHAALQFCLAHSAVSTVIPGMRRKEHVLTNVLASEGTLTNGELKRIKTHRWIRNFYTGLH